MIIIVPKINYKTVLLYADGIKKNHPDSYTGR